MTSANPNPSPATIKTRFLLLSDTHSHPLQPPSAPDRAYRSPLPHAEVLIHSGDLSFSGELDEYRRTFDVIKSSDAQIKIVIPGNHDLSLDREYWNEMLERVDPDSPTGQPEMRAIAKEARELWTGEEARKAGIVYLEEEGVKTFQINGARFTVWTTPYTPEFCHMAFAYARDDDRFNAPEDTLFSDSSFAAPNPAPSWPAVDIMITHGPPKYHMDGVTQHTTRGPVDMPVGCLNQAHALSRVRPRLSVFGHIHEGWGAEVVDWTVKGEVSKEGLELGETRKVQVGSKDEEVLERGYAYVDASTLEGGMGVRWGEESLLVNAAILDRRGRPENAPWVVDLDLMRVD